MNSMSNEINSVDELASFLDEHGASQTDIDAVVNAFKTNDGFDEGTDVTVTLTARRFDTNGDLTAEEQTEAQTLNI